MNTQKAPSAWRVLVLFSFFANLLFLFFTLQRAWLLGVVLWRSVWVLPLAGYFFGLACSGIILMSGEKTISFTQSILRPISQKWDNLTKWPPTILLRGVNGLVIIFTIIAIPLAKFQLQIGQQVKHSTQDPILTGVLFYWVAWLLILIGIFFATQYFGGKVWKGTLVFLTLTGVAYELYYRFQGVNHYPFSLGWSESSRYFYASLLFSKQLYGQQFPLSVLHPSRYILQSLVFLLPGSNLFASRMWQAILWVGLTAVSAYAVPRRVFRGDAWFAKEPTIIWLISGWIFLFLLRVGVYYHLEPIVFLPLLAFKESAEWKKYLLLVLASVWAGISRVNWFIVPGVLLAIAYVFEMPIKARNNWLAYFWKPSIYILASALAALTSQWLYIFISGNQSNTKAFSSSFTSDLLWYRLLPNDSFPLGILAAVAIMYFPILVIFATNLKRFFHTFHWLRISFIILANLAFLLGSLIVSVKIGGGGDLHNTDAFAVVLLVSVLFSASTQIKMEAGDEDSHNQRTPAWWVVVLAAFLPIYFLIPAIDPLPKYNQKADSAALSTLQQKVEEYRNDGKVLFINERHLVTFGQIPGPLQYDYEAVTLMEMAMSGNTVYLNLFEQRIKGHEYSVIVSGKLNEGIKDSGPFFEENNVWNSRVSSTILCYYEPAVIATKPETTTMIEAEESKITVLIPKQPAGDCQ